MIGAGWGDWPAWRGPSGDGRSLETEAPLRWSRTENVRWRVALPGPGNSTPAVWGDTVFLTQGAGTTRVVTALDRRNGRVRWNLGVPGVARERTQRSNPAGSSSPVTDGERVVAWFGSAGLVAVDMEGRGLWRLDLGRQEHRFGYGSSPVMDDRRVYLNFGPGSREFVVAVDKRTGREVWRVEGPVPGADDTYGTWSTPLLAEVEGRWQLLVALRDHVAGLNPDSGHTIWQARGLGLQAKASPVAGGGVVVVAGDLRGAELAIRLGGRGDVTDTHRVWRESPARSRIGTGVIHEGHLYGARANGILDCLDLETGEPVWSERMPGAGANGAIWSSPMLVGDRIYVVNQGGDTVVIRASPRFEVLAVNALDEVVNASPAVSRGELFIRTWQALWCLGGTDGPTTGPGTSGSR
ncbi:MAG: PQQ-binding-like beta-propeller repeat protein [Verrucomicrobiae bacterium]|nr:PQQ-binding-like beta-propeller repeat protein [Verrucomicrobiae bacterium]